MGCIAALVGLVAPRFVLVAMWLFSDRLSLAFDRFVIGFLGFLLVPFTTLMYAIAYAPNGRVQGFGWVLVAVGVWLDVGSYRKSNRAARRRRRRQRRLA